MCSCGGNSSTRRRANVNTRASRVMTGRTPRAGEPLSEWEIIDRNSNERRRVTATRTAALDEAGAIGGGLRLIAPGT